MKWLKTESLFFFFFYIFFFFTQAPSDFIQFSPATEDESFVPGQVQSLKSASRLKVLKEKASYRVGEQVVKNKQIGKGIKTVTWRQFFNFQRLLLNCADCELHYLRRSGFDTSIAQVRSLARTHFKVLLISHTMPHALICPSRPCTYLSKSNVPP